MTATGYGTSAREYIKRAELCLRQNDPKYLFYAAFELRCAAEARMREYLDVWDHVSKKQKQGWEINKLGAAAERAFKSGDRVMRWTVLDEITNDTLAVLYYTPVTMKLRANAARLGDYLHGPKKHGQRTGAWWSEFRSLLDEMVCQLQVATTGTLLGPALMKGGRGIQLNTDIPPDTDINRIYRKDVVMTIRIDYLNNLPETLEREAVVWKKGE